MISSFVGTGSVHVASGSSVSSIGSVHLGSIICCELLLEKFEKSGTGWAPLYIRMIPKTN